MDEDSCLIDVLVVGAGPTGLTAACELARRGVEFRIIDKLASPDDKSRALALHARTLEILKLMGCVDRFLEIGRRINAISIFDGEKCLAHLGLAGIDSSYQFALAIPQFESERILHNHLLSCKKDVERGLEFVSLIEEADYLLARVRDADGREETIKCKYLLACDGAHSSVRHALSEPFEGGGYEELFQLADVKADWSGHEASDEIRAFSGEGGNAAFFPLPDGRWRVVTVIAPEKAVSYSGKTEPELSEIQAQIDAICPWNITVSEPVWLANFKVRYRKIKNYRRGRVFLAGDSAHCHSPVGGQGMNTGMQDAFNIAWKLELAARGIATETLLDSYHDERHAVAEQLLKSVDLMTRVNLLRAPVAREMRRWLMPLLTGQEAVQSRMRNFLSEVGINYRRSPVVFENISGPLQAALSPQADSKPRFGDWFEFTHGPHPGDRLGEACMVDAANGGHLLLSSLLSCGKHCLLLLTGDDPSLQTYELLSGIAEEASRKYGDFLEAVLISCDESFPEGLNFAGAKFLDPDYSVHERLGAGSPCLYLIRPDAYVGYRGQPATFDGIEEYFKRILKI